MLSRFFHARCSLKPFSAPAAKPTVPAETGSPLAGALCRPHADYDRRPLETTGFDHYVDWSEDDERFFVH